MESDTTDVNTRLLNNGGDFFLSTINDAKSSVTNRLSLDHATGDISFYDDTGVSQALFWDASAESLGIGTTSPAAKLDVYQGELKVTGTLANWSVDYQGVIMDFTRASTSYIRASNAAGQLQFQTGGSNNRMIIDSSGRVGIGTTSPQTSTKGLHVVHDATEGTPSFPDGEVIIAQRNFNSSQGCHIGIIAGSASESAINFGDKDDSDVGNITYNHSSNSMSFFTGGTERMRIDSAGALLIGTSVGGLTATGTSINSNGTGAMVCNFTSANEIFSYNNNNATGTSYEIDFRQNNTEVGRIGVGSSTTTYATSSDYRLKENIQPLANGLERVKQLNPVQFDWKKDGESSEGFIAHEVQEIFNDAVVGEKDGDKMQGMDYGRITPLLVKAIQEQQVLIEQLQAEVALLKGE